MSPTHALIENGRIPPESAELLKVLDTNWKLWTLWKGFTSWGRLFGEREVESASAFHLETLLTFESASMKVSLQKFFLLRVSILKCKPLFCNNTSIRRQWTFCPCSSLTSLGPLMVGMDYVQTLMVPVFFHDEIFYLYYMVVANPFIALFHKSVWRTIEAIVRTD